jgi:predicted Ser/Thr protein kinase/uncharacterized protein YgiM (DUF1202 family)
VLVSLGELPQLIGSYQVLGVIGHGGMSTVYKALQPDLDRVVAIKVLLPGLASDPAFRQRFEREARVIASLRHANIVTIYAIGEDNGQPYLVMEYLHGPTLHELIRQRRQAGTVFSPSETLAFLRPLSNALDYAHDRQIIHRDLKPENIIQTPQGPVITDFGLAKLLQEEVADMSIVMGTPAYMAPEQIKGEPTDRRTDVYALGVLLYELLVGQVPFSGSSPTAVTQAHLEQPPPAFVTLNGRVPPMPGLEQVAQRALRKEKEERWASAGALYAALLNAASSTTDAAVPPRPVPVDLSAPTRAVPRPTPPQPQPRGEQQWGRLVLLLPLLALLIVGIIAARLWSRGGQTTADARVATVEAAQTSAADDAITAPTEPIAIAELTAQPTALFPTLVPVAATELPTPSAEATPTPEPPTTSPDTGPGRGRVRAPSGAYLRAGPGTSYPVIGGLSNDVVVTALRQSGDWLDILADSGERGWIARSLISSDDTFAALPTFVPAPTTSPQPTTVPAVPTEAPVPPPTDPPDPTAVVASGDSITLEDTAFVGGFRNRGASVYGGRTSTWVYGQESGYNRMSATFAVQGVRTGTATLVIEGMDSEDRAKTPLVIVLNDVVLFEGASPFPNDDMPLQSGVWGSVSLQFDAALLRDGTNVVSLVNLAPGRRGLPPFVALDYAILQLP